MGSVVQAHHIAPRPVLAHLFIDFPPPAIWLMETQQPLEGIHAVNRLNRGGVDPRATWRQKERVVRLEACTSCIFLNLIAFYAGATHGLEYRAREPIIKVRIDVLAV
eukprot:CAMPEP_0174729024 /NCGR_PEP_ID=MMETSP1094-20130205/52860_1 /TAXON_ID=156173 /ORGANISM="Chrysochromulina brevifilum, Strain UTEX LB 985" /LENGTH=106 /DNA_ID=CAMNT_0015931055 /DNA_START=868 /DNA_END=1188 /DNA_ORIENTATION=-